MDAVTSVVPNIVHRARPSLITAPVHQQDIGVLIGITGDVRGRLILESKRETFGSVAAALFGMALEGEMLDSFVGELGNMIAGNMCTYASGQGVNVDITPPTVMVGESNLYGFEKAILIPLEVSSGGNMQILLILEEEC
jgi:chemotaxis protein CheX